MANVVVENFNLLPDEFSNRKYPKCFLFCCISICNKHRFFVIQTNGSHKHVIWKRGAVFSFSEDALVRREVSGKGGVLILWLIVGSCESC